MGKLDDILDKPLSQLEFELAKRGDEATTEEIGRQVKQEIYDWIWDEVQPCEPECTPERHAYHQAQWDMAIRLTGRNHP